MQWHPLAVVADRVGCRLWLLCRAAPLGTHHSGRPDAAHRCCEQRAARRRGRCGHLLLGTAICGRFFSLLSRLAHFCLCRGVHAARSFVLVSSSAIEEGGECVVTWLAADSSSP